MAKVKAPLFSFKAAGKLADSLVYFNWKGLNVIRSWVVPANPDTQPQKDQRGYLRAAVAAIHTAQALAAYPLNEADIMAYSLWGSTFPVPRTWFNQAVKNFLHSKVAGKTATVFRAGGAVEGDTTLLVTVFSTEIDGAKITSGKFFWGPSKTALYNSGQAQIDAESHAANFLIEGLTNDTKYFWQFKDDAGETYKRAISGIYYNTPTAP